VQFSLYLLSFYCQIGEGALLHPQKLRSASIRCVTPVHAIEVNREYFEKYLANQEGKTDLVVTAPWARIFA
jgi:CRP-like cAMP-binding protein